MIATVQTAPQIAQGAVALVQRKFGFRLGYDPPSLIVLDAIIDKIKETGATQHQASGLLLGLGCYAGEVFVRNAHGSWRATAEMSMTRSVAHPIVIALPGAIGCDPLGAVFRRFNAGPPEGATSLYEATVMGRK